MAAIRGIDEVFPEYGPAVFQTWAQSRQHAYVQPNFEERMDAWTEKYRAAQAQAEYDAKTLPDKWFSTAFDYFKSGVEKVGNIGMMAGGT